MNFLRYKLTLLALPAWNSGIKSSAATPKLPSIPSSNCSINRLGSKTGGLYRVCKLSSGLEISRLYENMAGNNNSVENPEFGV